MNGRPTRPKLGLALSGAAARSVFYVGFLEVLQENDVTVDVIAAQSGASVVAASFACGTLEKLKHDLFTMSWPRLRALLGRAKKGGYYTLDIVEEYFREHYTLSKTFDAVSPQLYFVASDLNSGETVPLAIGDLARGMRVTCSVPGIFSPVQWGSRHLVDGGLLSVIPGKLAREAGVDVVVGVDAKATRHIFLASHMRLRGWYNFARNELVMGPVTRGWSLFRRVFTSGGADDYLEAIDLFPEDETGGHSWLKVLGRSLDLASKAEAASAKNTDNFGCDIIISQGLGKFGDSVSIANIKGLYEEGRQTALDNLPRIQSLLQQAASNK